PQGAAGPMGDWLRDGAAAWPAGPPPYPPAAPWVAPPEQDDGRPRWSWGTAAPWVVAGLLCALLLTSRAAPPAPEPVAVPSPAAPAELAAVPAPQPACVEVAQ
ncbi:MAG TPA: hypothetical protein VNU01_10050, partial [Egibacteraceae bacterium]|nr:hypothetical protein [Egibacteraceae bacterium]